MTAAAVTALAGIVGAAHVLTDPDTTVGYRTDWTGRYRADAVAVVRPRSTAEVVGLVEVCAAQGLAICTQGGNTGLVGGSVPADGSRPTVVLSTTRMRDVVVDRADACIDAQAGVPVADLHRRAADVGLAFGVDLASRDSATAGGIVATNAGGIQVIAHGDTRRQVIGIEAVLADGRLVRRWRPVAKDNVGYDVPGLLAGSEGTLAIITRVLFRMVRPPSARFVALAAVSGVGVALDLIGAVRAAGLTVQAAELITRMGIEVVRANRTLRVPPFDAPFAVLIDVSGPGDLAAVVDAAVDGVDGAVAVTGEPAPARDLWEIREGHTEAVARSSTTTPIKLDVAVPLSRIESTLDQLVVLGDSTQGGCRTVVFGHLGEGNLHVNYLDVVDDDQPRLTEAALRIVDEVGGSVSAEHGVGRAKRTWLAAREPGDVAVMAALKRTFDPNGLLNPGVLW